MEVNRYERRLNGMKRFIELRAPKPLIYFAAENLILDRFNNSRLRVGIYFLKSWYYNFFLCKKESFRMWFYTIILRRTIDEALDKVFGKDLSETKKAS